MCSTCGGLLIGLFAGVVTLFSFILVLLGELLQALINWIYIKARFKTVTPQKW